MDLEGGRPLIGVGRVERVERIESLLSSPVSKCVFAEKRSRRVNTLIFIKLMALSTDFQFIRQRIYKTNLDSL